jgi:hypothetical protein
MFKFDGISQYCNNFEDFIALFLGISLDLMVVFLSYHTQETTSGKYETGIIWKLFIRNYLGKCFEV